MINLTTLPLFKDLTSLEINGTIVDIHNEYTVTHISYDVKFNIFKMTITPLFLDKEKRKYGISFKDVELTRLNLFSKRLKDSTTMNNFYRGRFEEDGKAIDLSSNGRSYFYLEFENGNQFEFFAKEGKLFEL